jgi:hypothetical protein
MREAAVTEPYNVLVRPLAAPSPAEFWRPWNPVWGYVLAVWCYRPARRVLSHAAAVMVTFTAVDLSRLPAPARVVVNLAYLIGCYRLAVLLLP